MESTCNRRSHFVALAEVSYAVEMSLPVTFGLIGLFAATGLFCAWRGAAPPDPHRGPRLVPYRFLMVLCGAIVLYLAAHVLNLMGITTGR